MKMNPVVHFEMPAQDRKRMADFYTRVFGWQTQQLGPEMGNYVVVTTTELGENRFPKEPGRINGGFFTKTKDNQYPSVVIAVDDIKTAMKKVQEAGGKVLVYRARFPGQSIGLVMLHSAPERQRAPARGCDGPVVRSATAGCSNR